MAFVQSKHLSPLLSADGDPVQYAVVDAFTHKTFEGNPAAVIILDESECLDETMLQNIAREFNLSETAFIAVGRNGDHTFGLRWFTPETEVALCGHATLAAAHVLFKLPALVPLHINSICFQTRKSGVLTARRVSDAEHDGETEIELPAGEVLDVGTLDSARCAKVALAVTEALGVEVGIPFVGAGEGASFEGYLLVELQAPFDLAKSNVNPGVFASLAPEYTIIMLTTASSDPSVTFTSRVFAPAFGVPEDPVTGSAHCLLGPYWHKKLQLGRDESLTAHQVSRRGGTLRVIWDKDRNMCKLKGNAVLTSKGEIFLNKI